MPLNKSFASVLKKLRIQNGLSQEGLAFKANLHRTYISQLERGLKSPTLNTISILAHVLGISLTQFVKSIQEDMKE